MVSRRAAIPARHLFNGFKRYQQSTRYMATQIDIPNSTLSQAYKDAHLTSTSTEPILRDEVDIPPPEPSISIPRPFQAQQNPFLTTTQCTLHSFPSMEPMSQMTYPSTHLLVPMRKDILHRAIVYEGDSTRQGTANTKHRSEVHGSGRKIRPQKGTGMARLGDKKSPMLRGGGVAFGPKPRDFATGLPKQVYDLAWRIALSYRYKMGQLFLLENGADLNHVHQSSRSRYLADLLRHNRMGHKEGRTIFITLSERKSLYRALEEDNMGRHAEARDVDATDVKNLLEARRLVMERRALDEILRRHESDLDKKLSLAKQRALPNGFGEAVGSNVRTSI